MQTITTYLDSVYGASHYRIVEDEVHVYGSNKEGHGWYFEYWLSDVVALLTDNKV